MEISWELIDPIAHVQSWCILVMCTMRMARKSLPMRSKRKSTSSSLEVWSDRVPQVFNPPSWTPLKEKYPINTHYVRCIWGWLLRGPHPKGTTIFPMNSWINPIYIGGEGHPTFTTIDGSEIRQTNHLGYIKLVNNWIYKHINRLAGFLRILINLIMCI